MLLKARRNFLDALLERKREWNIESYIYRTEDPEGNLHFTHIEASDENGGKAYTCNAHNMKLRSIERGERQVLFPSGELGQSEIFRRYIQRGYKVNLIIRRCVYSMMQLAVHGRGQSHVVVCANWGKSNSPQTPSVDCVKNKWWENGKENGREYKTASCALWGVSRMNGRGKIE